MEIVLLAPAALASGIENAVLLVPLTGTAKADETRVAARAAPASVCFRVWFIWFLRGGVESVSYTHLDVYKRQVQMLVQVCAQHLLYPARCQGRRIGLRAGGWQHWESKLSGYPFKTGAWQSVGRGVFLLSVLTPGANVEIANLQLSAGGGNLNLLRNSQFLDGGAGWFPAVRSYFLPWRCV